MKHISKETYDKLHDFIRSMDEGHGEFEADGVWFEVYVEFHFQKEWDEDIGYYADKVIDYWKVEPMDEDTDFDESLIHI